MRYLLAWAVLLSVAPGCSTFQAAVPAANASNLVAELPTPARAGDLESTVEPVAYLGQDAPEKPAPQRQMLRVISYNVQFLPLPARAWNKRPDGSYRAGEIGRQLAAYDVVGLNEVFELSARHRLLDQLRAAWGDDCHIVASKQPLNCKFNAGLAIASRLPVIESHQLTYSKGSSFLKHGFHADGMAAKGALHARLWRGPTESVDLFITHLESKDAKIRDFQIGELGGFIAKYSQANQPVLIMGDLNTDGRPPEQQNPASQYVRMLSTLGLATPGRTLVDLWPKLKGAEGGGTTNQEGADGGKRIDYILLAAPDRRCQPVAVRVNPFLDKRTGALSDHSAVEADLSWETQP